MAQEHEADVNGEFAAAGNLKELHGALLSTQSVEEFLHEMAVLAARLVSGGLACGMATEPNGKPVTVACSDPLAARVDQMQYELDDGPGLSSHATLIEQLRSSLASRGVIDQALGIIMAREHCTQDRAFAILRSASQNRNVKLRDLASAVVTSVTGEPPQPSPPFEDGQFTEGQLAEGRYVEGRP
jgi:ANTAR domain